MGMFQPQNYGADFVNSMSATAGMMNDRRRMDLAEKEQAAQEKRYAAEAETRTLQNQGLTLENQKKTADLDREKKLQSFLDLSGRMNSGNLTPEDYGSLAGVTGELMQDTPYLPSDPAEIPKYRQALATVMQGAEKIRALPASNYQYSREDNVPEVNAVLDSFQTLLSKDRLGKTFTDADGSITGTPGATYKTAGVGGFAMVSGEGNKAAFTPLFSVTDAQDKPIVGANGKAVMVPSTEGATNGAQDKVRQITPEEMLTKAGYAYKVLDVADKLGLADPEKRKQYVSNTLPAYMGEEGAKELLKRGEKKKGVKERDPYKDIIDEETGEVIQYGETKEKEDKAPARNTFERDGFKITEEYVGNGQWKEIARNKIKEPREPRDPAIAENKRQETQSKAAIDKAIDAVNAAKTRLAAAKKNDPESQDAKEASQELADAKTSYLNRTKEHKDSFGREYNPIKEVVERKQARDISPLQAGFEEDSGVFSKRDYPSFIAKAEAKGWTREEIIKAAAGTGGEPAVNEYYAKPKAAPAQSAAPAKKAPPAKGMAAPTQKTAPKQTAKADTRPPLSSFKKR